MRSARLLLLRGGGEDLVSTAPARYAAVAGLVVLIASGCGGQRPGTATTATADPGVAFAQCMRKNGVPSFPDPGASTPSRIDAHSSAFQHALQACQELSPKKAPPARHPSESQRQAALAFAQCMRKHGYPEFPDPTPTPPGPGHGTLLGAFDEYFVLAPGTGIQPHSSASACGVNPAATSATAASGH